MLYCGVFGFFRVTARILGGHSANEEVENGDDDDSAPTSPASSDSAEAETGAGKLSVVVTHAEYTGQNILPLLAQVGS